MTFQRTVTAKQLTLLMLTLITVPIACGILLFFNSPKLGEPPLPVEIKLGTSWLDESSKERRLVPCIFIKNQSDGWLKKLSVGLNAQFYSTGNGEIEPRKEVILPLEAFIARNGSVRFPVGNRLITQVTVMAQLPNGARGISEFEIPNDSGKTTEGSDWIVPKP